MKTVIPVNSVSAKQSGQAAIEALVCLLALGVLWTGVAWLARIQDLALQASNASRHAAFLAVRQDQDTPAQAVVVGAFQGQANRWADRGGQALQRTVYQDIRVDFRRSNEPLDYVQAGGADPQIVQLGEDWLRADQRVLSAHVSLIPSIADSEAAEQNSLFKLYQFDAAYPLIGRQTSILTGAGHSGDDVSAADRIANSSLAWSGPANQSYRLGRRVTSVGSRIDAAWGRPEPVFDWLHPWAEHLPSHHLRANR